MRLLAYHLQISPTRIFPKNQGPKAIQLRLNFTNIIKLSLLLIVVATTVANAGISGTLSGRVLDKHTQTILPGASILVEGTTLGAMADKSGRFKIHNLPAGTYNVIFSMIGYAKLTIRNIQINVDLDTALEGELTAEVLPLDEVVITRQSNLIQTEVPSSTYFISGEDINERLPIDSFMDAVALLPGVVGTHVRGGRETDVLYMLDGLPIQGGLARTLSSSIPNSAIIEMMVQTGGFSAEYGQATSGVVNVITKDGRNEVAANMKFFTDFVDTEVTENHNTRRLEFDLGGPMTIGLGGPMINAKYFVSANINLSDTPDREQLQSALKSPIFSNYNLNAKLSFDISSNTILTLQALVSNWDWHQFDPQWQLNPIGLAENKHRSHRLSASLTHTFSPKVFASLRAANYSFRRSVLGEIESDPPELTFADPTDPFSQVVSGGQPWNERTGEDIDMVKFDLLAQASASHMFKFGFDVQKFHLESKKTQFTPLPALNDAGIVLNRTSHDFEFAPDFFSLYAQDRIKLGSLTATLGLRYDVFAPKLSLGEVPQSFKQVQIRLNAPVINTSSEEHKPLSPRIALSLPISGNGLVQGSYGHYYQMPPLYYLYTNSDYRVDTYLPIVGNADLRPTKTEAWEFSYKRIVDDWLLMLTGFTRSFSNLVDTQTFALADSLVTSDLTNIGFTQYRNTASGTTSGLELTVQKQISAKVMSRLSYTLMTARGTNSSAEDEFNGVVFGTPIAGGDRFPLSWDRRHSFILDTSYDSKDFKLSVLYRLLSPLPVTTRQSTTPNDTRLSWKNLLDLKLQLTSARILGRHASPFFEVRNLMNENAIFSTTDQTGINAYRLFDPLGDDRGRRLRLGIAMQF